jgi:starch phosphorylase
MGKSAGISLSLSFRTGRGRSARRPRDQRSSHADLGLGGADDLWTKACGKDRWLGTTETLEQDIRRVSDDSLWQFRMAASKSLVEYARQRLARHYAAAGASPETVEEARHLFDPNVLTLGFARRFATYKRPNLLLHDPERLLRLLSNPQRPVQLILAGKAHPADRRDRP